MKVRPKLESVVFGAELHPKIGRGLSALEPPLERDQNQ
jgi:hypothetical protein